MRVNSFINTTSYYSPKFKGKEDEFKDSNDGWNVICEDPSTAEVRKWLREDYEENVLPYSSRYSKHTDEPNVSEHMLIYHNKFPYNEPVKLEDYENSYRGMSLVNYPKTLKELKNKGIKTVISLNPIFDDYDEENMGMKLIYMSDRLSPMDWKDKDYNAFADIISCMKKGNFYIGCMLGSNRTTLFLNIADYFVHPNRWDPNGENPPVVACVEDFIELATPEQKERMGLTEEDEKLIKQRIIKESLIRKEKDKHSPTNLE